MNIIKKLSLATAGAAFIGLIAAPAHAVTLTIDGTDNIFGAGVSTPPAPGGGGGGTLPSVFEFQSAPGQILSFSSVAGSVSCCFVNRPNPRFNGPDGANVTSDAGGNTNINSIGGISGIVNLNASIFLTGVFLDSSGQPGSAPPRLDFTGNTNFATLKPQLGQTFFIGDGLTGTGTGSVQQFDVPESATQLYLGFADAFQLQNDPGWYADNAGSLQATFEVTEVPFEFSPGLGILLLGAWGAIGQLKRKV